MAKNRNNSKLTPEQLLLHKSFASGRLTNAYLSIKAIQESCANCADKTFVVQGLIRDAVVQYGSIFKCSNIGNDKMHKLEESIVPAQFRELHNQLISYRDQLFAHFDFEMMNPVKQESDQGISWLVDNKGPSDFMDKLADIRALVVHLMRQLGSEVVKEHQELSQNE